VRTNSSKLIFFLNKSLTSCSTMFYYIFSKMSLFFDLGICSHTFSDISSTSPHHVYINLLSHFQLSVSFFLFVQNIKDFFFFSRILVFLAEGLNTYCPLIFLRLNAIP